MSYSAYKLTDKSRAKLLAAVPPIHSKVIAEHITYVFPSNTLPPDCKTAIVLVEASDDKVQAVGVALKYDEANTNAIRPDGKMFHITISIDAENGGKPVMSNDLLATTAGTPVVVFEVEIEPVVL